MIQKTHILLIVLASTLVFSHIIYSQEKNNIQEISTHISVDKEHPNLSKIKPGFMSYIPFVKGVLTNMIIKQRVQPKRAALLQTPSDYGMKYQSIDIMSSDGIRLSAWEITVPNSNKLAVINHPLTCTRYGCIEGLDGVSAIYMPMLKSLYDAGYNIITYDERGQGESDGGIDKTRIGKEAPVGVGALEWQDFIGVMTFVQDSPKYKDSAVALIVQCMGANSALIALEHQPDILENTNVKAFVAVQPTISYNMTARLIYEKLKMDFVQKVENTQKENFGYGHANSLKGAKLVKVPILFTQVRNDVYTFDKGTGRNDIELIYDAVPIDKKEILWIGPEEENKYGTGNRFDAYNYFNDYPEDLLDFLNKYL